ncbi:alpha/beta hydrolase [Alcanivorax marinus]|uniref:Alpha/beta hydrolase n=1 Tax=Alloalcanivorax marinus TaxID=1177169 RepID=A0A9Q3ULY3_9GAMM|nr:alpha/beta fold hydrolase [Alloalcanivorax marinus]MCC4308441.1 alpha/beta hydrolase [Alloalcanivorax marinus]
MSALSFARRLSVVCLCAVVAACGGGSDSDGAVPPDPLAGYRQQTLDWQPCDPSILGSPEGLPAELEDRVRCAQVRAPMDYRAPRRGEVTLAVMKVAAEEPARKLGALFFNPGGPGVDGLGLASHFGALWTGADPATPGGALRREMSKRYDLIGFSPRGTGASSALSCESNELYRPARFASDDRSADNIEALLYNAGLKARTCLKNPLARYINTEQTVHDLDLMRGLLGDPRLNYIGYSYGTWLGAWYAARYPHRVGRMLLDSSMDFSADFDEASRSQVRASQRVMDQVLAGYASRHPDRFGLGDSEDAFRDVFGRLPSDLKALAAESLQLGNRRLTEENLLAYKTLSILGELLDAAPDAGAAQLHQALDDRGMLVARAEDDTRLREATHQLIDTYLERRSEPPEPVDLGRMAATFLAVVCNDTASRTERDYWVTLGDQYAVTYPLLGGGITAQPCLYWGGPSVSKPSAAAVAEAGTLLMVQSQYDALTLTEGAMALFDQLPAARLIYVEEEYTHGVFPYETDCVDLPVLRYFIDGTVPARRTDCAGRPLPGDEPAGRSLRALAAPASPYRDPDQADLSVQRIKAIIAGRPYQR